MLLHHHLMTGNNNYYYCYLSFHIPQFKHVFALSDHLFCVPFIYLVQLISSNYNKVIATIKISCCVMVFEMAALFLILIAQ